MQSDILICRNTDGLPMPIPLNHVILDYAFCLLIVSDQIVKNGPLLSLVI
jgi:hypothetical protein